MTSCLRYACRSGKPPPDRVPSDSPPSLIASPTEAISVPNPPVPQERINLNVLFYNEQPRDRFTEIVLERLAHSGFRDSALKVRLVALAGVGPLVPEEHVDAHMLLLPKSSFPLRKENAQNLIKYFMHFESDDPLLVLSCTRRLPACTLACYVHGKHWYYTKVESHLREGLTTLTSRPCRITICSEYEAEHALDLILASIKETVKQKRSRPSIIQRLLAHVASAEASARETVSGPFEPYSSLPAPQVFAEPLRPKRTTKKAGEYEDLPNWRLEDSLTPARLCKSDSVTELQLAAQITAGRKPDEPRYDAEYETFRSRRETRRFVRRLREAMQFFRRAIERTSENLDRNSGVTRSGISHSRPTPSLLTDTTALPSDTSMEGTIIEVDLSILGPVVPNHVSITESIAHEIEPIIWSVPQRITSPAEQRVRTDGAVRPLPVDSFETILLNPNLFRPAEPQRVPQNTNGSREVEEQEPSSNTDAREEQ